jgi:hypothetical protein
MNKYRMKEIIIDAISFDELVELGKLSAPVLVKGMPWSFSVNGYTVTHENDNLYLVSRTHGEPLKFGRGQMLTFTKRGEPMFVMTREGFNDIYEPIAPVRPEDSTDRANESSQVRPEGCCT